ncbi:major paralogous domain-containing protein [Fibrobacter sp. UWR3]|uniref:fibrobacter succinogenes major paralogous domain-containing protein n=1 Tax=Fibrobacter sp. UWR3 TaxID=1896217 RepID=UPI00091F76AA|nr:fibrobacter succinogenes major paralogous domain-containing protein [Fibrobacter sp. UWR3]SHM78080.1 major paralogous domain-containing protein [Fibrobacter sp. UWR3]
MLKAKHGFSFVAAAVSVLLLVACGDDDSDFATRPSDGSSSSVTPQSSDSETSVSSSSEAKSSSSSVTPQSSDSETSVSTGTMTDSRDGQTYKTVTIGTQTWMAQNLNYETANSYCYKDSASYCTKYGRLYTWEAATTACPDGWHLPTKAEFETLFTAVGGQSTAGKVLKSTSGWSGNGSDAFAFSALPAGFRYGDGLYYHEGYYAYFWSSTEYYSDSAYNMYLYHNYESANVINDKYYGFSVRCLKDEGETVQSSSSVTPQSSDSETSVSSSSVKSSSSVAFSSSTKSSSSEKAESSSSKVTEPAEVTSGTMTDSRDGQTYKTVTIGTQTWMAQNLNYTYTDVPYKNGDYTSDSTSWCYNDDASNCSKYGRLYTWAAAMDSVGTWSTNGKGCGYNKTCSPTYPVRGVCPKGWHLPTEEEFETLFTAVGGQSTVGKVLKSTSGWNSSGNGTDAFAFSALPAGFRGSNGIYLYEGYGAYFWSSTEDGSYYAYNMALRYGNDDAYLDGTNALKGFSVRCLKD